MKKRPILVSACLAGIKCRYNGGDAFSFKIVKFLKNHSIIIVCPELLSGLPIPRTPCQIVGGDGNDVLNHKAKVLGQDGRDYTQEFIHGAKLALAIALKNKIFQAYLKQKSPSCGCGFIYKGKQLVKGDGVFTALLKRNKIKTNAI